MIFHRPLNEILHSWTHVAVMRVLQDTAVGFTGNQIARAARMHPRSALKALSALETLGLVCRQRGGRDHIFTLNREHLLVAQGILPLLQCERSMIESLEKELARMLDGKVTVAILFGSVVRQEENQGSDVDLCCVVNYDGDRLVVEQALDANARGFFRNFGARLSPVVFTEEEFRRKRRTPLVRAILTDGRVVAGKLPEALRHG